MKKIIPLLALFFSLTLTAQNYNMSTTNVTTCGGTFYDSGGANSNYGNGQNFTMTFCPSTPGSAIRLDFSAFNLSNGDQMFIYDGPDISAPQFGTFTGTDSPSIVQATGDNASGCITIRFVSDTNTTAPGWAAAVSCITPCQVINAQLDSSAPAADPDGIIRICQGESVTFNGSGTFSNSGANAVYEWDFDNGTTAVGQTATATFTTPGVYRVNLLITDPLDCVNNNRINQVVQVSTTPTFTTPSSADEICLGMSAAISGLVDPTPWIYECTPPVSGTTFLPDGSGASYTTSITVDCFDANQTITNMNQIQSICLNMEHSYLGDLRIAIISPNGQQVILKAYPGGGGTYLGAPLDDPQPGPGTGAEYCFSMSGSTLLVNGPTVTAGNPANNSIAAGTYLPAASFAGLIGSPLNGTWTIQVTDNLGIDNGYIFSWGMTFDPALVPGDLSFTPVFAAEDQGWMTDPTITSTTGNTITVQPSAPGTYCYTFYATDNHGCTYTTQKCITVLEPAPLAPAEDLTDCNTFDLTINYPIILNGLDPDFYPILFHHSQDDAENVFDEILTPEDYAGVDGEVIYYSVQDYVNPANCIYTGSFTLHTTDCPAPVSPPDLIVCDDASNDGVATFDFTPQTAIALGTFDPAEYAISYHLTFEAATDGINPISPIDSFTNTSNCQTIYVRMERISDPLEFGIADFDVCVIALPETPNPADVIVCDSYTLPDLPDGSTYHDGTAGGAVIPEGSVITVSQTIVIVNESGTVPNCTTEGDFEVTIILTPAVPTVADVTACDSYTLPALPAGQSYHTAPGGNSPLGSLTITATQEIWHFVETETVPNCTSEASFTVTIVPTPIAPDPADVTVCDSYVLPALPAGQTYHENTSAGAFIPEGTIITTSQTIVIVAETATTPSCTSEGDFTITIIPTPAAPDVADITACDTYTLPALPAGQSYHTAPGGSSPLGSLTITATQEIWHFIETETVPNCTNEASFIVTIVPTPIAPDPADVTVCDSYVLPVLPAGQTYHENTSAGAFIPEGTIITTSQTIVIVAETATTPSCTSEGDFVITIIDSPDTPLVADVTACDTYELPPLPAGQSYHTAPGGESPIASPTITATQEIWHFVETGTVPNCTAEASFTVTIVDTPPTPLVDDVTACDTYELPALSAGQTYHTASGGDPSTQITGSDLTIEQTQVVYVFAQTGTTPNCTSEASFTVTINDTPQADAPSDVTACDSYVLPALTVGNYYDGPGGTGNQYFAGDVITSTITLCVYAETGTTPNCFTENCFTITINNTPATPVVSDVTACDSYTLPDLPAGHTYHTASGGDVATQLVGNDLNIDETTVVYVFAQTATTPNCTSEASFTVTINDTPQADAPSDVVACDSYVLPALAVGDYFDAPGGNGMQYFEGDEIFADITLYVYAETGTTPNCFSENSFTISIYETPVISAPTTLQLCDDNNDGIQCFDLTAAADEILNGNTEWVVSFYETEVDAQNGFVQTQLPYDYCNILQGLQTIYVRVAHVDAPQCAAFTTLLLQVNPRPMPNPVIAAYELCDVNNPGDGIEAFDLVSMDAEILNGQTGIEVAYYASQADAQVPQNPIDTSVPYINGMSPQQIWFTVSNPSTGCFSMGSFNLVVNPLPVINELEPMNSCSDGLSDTAEFNLIENDVLVAGQPGMTVTYYETLAQAQDGTSGQLPSPYTSQSTIIYVRVENADTGCFQTTSLELIVSQGPVAHTPTPLQECDPNNDGIAMFDLTQAANDIHGGPPPAGVVITYYETAVDAQNGYGPSQIQNPSGYENVNPWTQTVYIRVAFDFTGCANFTELQLIVNPTPEANEDADPLQMCDDNFDGIASFNLSLAIDNILNGLDPALYTVSFHTSQANAQVGTPAIAGILNYASGTATIWVRVENQATGCFDVVPLELIVNPLPVVPYPAPAYTLCDVDAPGNQTEVFDLFSQIGNIVGTQTGLLVTFHESALEAQDGINDLPQFYTIGDPPVQTLHVRVEDQVTGCFVVTTMDIRVEPLPVLIQPLADNPLLTACDADSDCFAYFDLDALIPGMVQGAPGIDVTFYETLEDAQGGESVNALSSPYQNIDPCTQVIYVRAENQNAAGCFSIITITLTVNPAPAMPVLEDLTQCDTDSNNQDGHSQFNLTVHEGDILAAQAGAATDYEFSYFASETAANLGHPAIVVPENYTNTIAFQQTVWVRIENTQTGCHKVGTFDLIVNIPLALTTPTPLSICDDGPPGTLPQAVFDLTVKDTEIIGANGAALGYTVQYFETAADQQAGTNPITPATAYTNTSNAQTLYVAVTGPAPTHCRSFTTLTIRVLPLPVPLTDAPEIQVCDATGTSGSGIFDLTLNEQYIANGDPDMIFEYYETSEDAHAQDNMIDPATAYSGQSGVVYIRVMRDVQTDYQGDFCYVVIEQQLMVNPLPQLSSNPYIYTECETDGDGFEIFTLSSINDDLLAAPQNVDDFTISYHATLADAQNAQNPLDDSYENTANPQDIYVLVINTVTKCETIGVVTLEVLPGADAFPVDPATFTTCDDDTDGLYVFDLTIADAQVLGTVQLPADFTVDYYVDLQHLADNEPIADYTAFESGTTTIYAVVNNLATGCQSESVPVTIVVEALADPVIVGDMGDSICVDFATQSLIRGLTLSTNMDPSQYTFEWYLGGSTTLLGTGPTYYATTEGEYSVVVTSLSDLGCGSVPATFTVIKSGPPVVDEPAFTVSNPFGDNQITINVSGFGDYEYSLDGGPWQSSNVFTNVGPGTHYADVRDGNTVSCGEVHIGDIIAINYPHYFTPNGDGIHDTWNIIGLEGDSSAKIYIFDRYGKLLKQISPAGQGWDGTFAGSLMPSTDYWFQVQFNDNGTQREFKAHFSLKR